MKNVSINAKKEMPQEHIYLVIRSPLGMSYRFMTMSGASKQHQMSQIEEFVKDKFYEDSINAFHRKTQKEINEIG